MKHKHRAQSERQAQVMMRAQALDKRIGDLNDSDSSEGRSQRSEDIKLVPKDQVNIECEQRYKHIPSSQRPRGRDGELGAIYGPIYMSRLIEIKEQ